MNDMSSKGFTLIELVLVIVLLGVLAITAAPRFFSSAGYDQIAARDQLIQLLRQAQLQTMNSSSACQVVHFSQNQASIPAVFNTDASCSVAATGEALGAFDRWGKPTQTTTFTITGESTVKVCIETEGYVHAC